MKKIILIAAAVFAFGFANAQEAKFGIKGGLNVSNFAGDSEGASSKVGFHVGGFTEIKISEKFAIQPELLFSTQGAKADVDGIDVKFNLSYLNIPVMAKYYVADRFSIEAGPQIGFLTSANMKVGSESADFKDNVESIDFGVNFGAGYNFTENISAGLRYNVGLSNVDKTQSGDNSKLTNSVFSVSLGYKF